MNAQIFVVFEIKRFFVIFSKKFRGNVNSIFTSKLEMSIFVVGAVRVRSESQGLQILPPHISGFF